MNQVVCLFAVMPALAASALSQVDFAVYTSGASDSVWSRDAGRSK